MYTKRAIIKRVRRSLLTFNEGLGLPITISNFGLTSGLTHVSPLQEIQSGEAFVVRFKNSSRKYNTDLWIGILLPDDFEHGPGLSRNPKGAKPVSGEWTTDLDKRVYPVYLPTYRMENSPLQVPY